eukprot:scaffold91156_cov36-Phaeocystis_antarctica.AAC.1
MESCKSQALQCAPHAGCGWLLQCAGSANQCLGGWRKLLSGSVPRSLPSVDRSPCRGSRLHKEHELGRIRSADLAFSASDHVRSPQVTAGNDRPCAVLERRVDLSI